ncbi:MAG: nitrous oxide reductase family maturation protein NosD [Myxococcales bacterium]
MIALLALFRVAAASVGCPGDGAGSLAEALARAVAGDTIEVCGRQRGAVVIPAGVAVIGRPGAVIDGLGAPIAVTLGDRARLESIEVGGERGDVATDDAAVLVTGRGAAVRHVRVRARAFGIYLREARGAEVIGCEVEGSAGRPPERRGNGIHVWNSSGNRISGNRIHGTRDGLYLSFAQHNRIERNEIWDVRYGIHDMYSDDNVIGGNRLHGCIGGAALMFCKRNVFEGNVSDDNLRYGLLLRDVDSTELDRNELVRDGKGLFVQHSFENRFVANWIGGNLIGLHLSAQAEENLFSGNAFVGNAQQVLLRGGRDNRWDDGSRGNYWSDYDGLDRDGDGIGDSAYRAGDLASYLADAYPMVRVLEMGPAYDALRAAEAAFPVIDYPGVIDRRPLVIPPPRGLP